MGSNIDGLVVDVYRRDVDLNIAACLELKDFSGGKFHYKFFNEGRDIVVGYHFTFPFLNSEDLLRDPDLHVLLYLHLTAQPDIAEFLLAAEVPQFGGKHITATRFHNAFARCTGTAAT